MNVLTNLNLNKNQLENAVIQNLATAPASPKMGQIYYNTVDKKLYIWDGTAWVSTGVAYEQTSSTGEVVTGLAADGTVSTTAIEDLVVSGEGDSAVTLGDIADKIDGIAAGAEVNVQSDWNVTDTTSDAFILNKPDIYTKDEIDDMVEGIEDEISDLDGKIDGIGSAVAGGLKFFVVSELPDLSTLTDEQFEAMTPGTIYLIPKDNGEAPDTKVEYIFIKGEDKEHSSYEQIGELQPSLEDYLKTEDLEDALEGVNISDTVVTVPAPTEEDADATEDVTISDIIGEMLDDIDAAQQAAEQAQEAAGDAQSAADAAQETADSALEAIEALSPADFIKKATATIAAGQTEATASFVLTNGETAVPMSIIAKDGGSIVYTDVEISATGAKFSIADAYTNAITCEVFYYVIK